MSKFWQKKYISEYTGAEIDAAVAKAGELTKVTANPTLAGTEAALTGLEVGDTKYKVEQPINVVANPTLAGTEAALEGLQVGETKYKVGGDNPFFLVKITENGGVFTADKTYAQITAAITAGLIPVATETSNPMPAFYAGQTLELGYTFINAPVQLPQTNQAAVMSAVLIINTDDSVTITGGAASWTVTSLA